MVKKQHTGFRDGECGQLALVHNYCELTPFDLIPERSCCFMTGILIKYVKIICKDIYFVQKNNHRGICTLDHPSAWNPMCRICDCDKVELKGTEG